MLHLLVAAIIVGTSSAQADPTDTGSQRAKADRVGNSVSITVGYLSALGDHSIVFVQGIYPTVISDNIFIGASVEGPTVWKTLYPFVVTKWFLGNRYDIDEEVSRYAETRGALLCGGLGYGVDAWQATMRLQTALGYWWENINLTYGAHPLLGPSDLGSVDQANDQLALLLTASLAFPFTERVHALISGEFLARPEEELEGMFENGRWYRIETNGTYGTVSIGLTVAFGSGRAGTQ